MTDAAVETYELVQNFRFAVTLSLSPGADPSAPPASGAGGPAAMLGNGYFAECNGLDLEADVKEYLEGGRNDGVVRRVGRVKLVPIVLKRGMFVPGDDARADAALWGWITGMTGGTLPVPRYDGLVQIFSADRTRVTAEWSFQRGLPLKVTGPTLNAKSGDIAMEELHIVHEGLRLERNDRR
jgi:phage tail-like protein